MNVKRFTARSSRDALVLVRQALGDDAVVLSTKPCAEGVEVLAMAPEGMRQIERMATDSAPAAPASSSSAPAASRAPAKSLAARSAERVDPALASPAPVDADVSQLAMSTLSFQDYVRDRLRRRRAESDAARKAAPARPAVAPAPALPEPSRAATRPPAHELPGVLEQRMTERAAAPPTRLAPMKSEASMTPAGAPSRPAPSLADAPPPQPDAPVRPATPPMLHHHAAAASPSTSAPLSAADQASARRDQNDMMNELRQVKGLIEERFGALAFMEKLNRQPGQARLTQKLLDCGFSPALIRKLGDSLPTDAADESAWAAGILERNLLTAENDTPLEDQGGVYALVGATGVGKTTTTAKIAAAFATKYGAANLGLITLDAYRVGAHEQLRAYGRILGVPVHTAHDRASLEDLLELLSAKRMVLIDTAGMAQRDTRTRELLEMLSHRVIQKLLVVNAASQGETIEDVMVAYRAATCAGIVLSKMDEAVKLGPALDTLIRHKLKVVGIANGQRVPEDWHRLTANALVARALRGGGSAAYRLDASDVSLIFTAPHGHAGSATPAMHH